MKDIMDSRQTGRQSKSVGNWSNSFQDFKWSYKMWKQFGSFTIPNRTFPGSNPQKYFVPNHKLTFNPMRIRILFLSIMCCSKVFPDLFHLLFHFLEHFRTQENFVFQIIPAQGCSTRSSIQSLKRSHTYRTVTTIIIYKFD